MYYYGDESEIDLEGHGEREFSDWRWMPLEQLPEEVMRLPHASPELRHDAMLVLSP